MTTRPDKQRRDLDTLAWLHQRQAAAINRYRKAQQKQQNAQGWFSHLLARANLWLAGHLMAARSKVYRDRLARAAPDIQNRHAIRFPNQAPNPLGSPTS